MTVRQARRDEQDLSQKGARGFHLEVRRFFDSAAQLPPHERSDFLVQSCPDPRIRLEVQSLLEYAAGTESFFAASVRDVAASMQAERDLSPGDRIGAYRILSVIG